MNIPDQAWLEQFVYESNEIDPQPEFDNRPGSPRWDDHLDAVSHAITASRQARAADPRAIHQILMGRMWPAIAGSLRTVNVGIGRHTCTPFWQVPEKLATWKQAISSQFEHRIDELRRLSTDNRLDAIWTKHIEFERIHPFRDGNGRTGRILMVNQALLAGVEPPLVRYRNRFDYYRRFERSSHGHMSS